MRVKSRKDNDALIAAICASDVLSPDGRMSVDWELFRNMQNWRCDEFFAVWRLKDGKVKQQKNIEEFSG